MTEPKCKEKILKGEKDWKTDFCYENPECHFCSDPYTCVIPHYLRHLLNIEHNENEQ